jgi:Tfp pilus assembly PilM family ATPase
LIRRANVDLKRMKEGGNVEYLEEMLTTQFRAEPGKMMLAVLSAVDGQEVDLTKPNVKEVLFCGSYAEDFTLIQTALLEAGVFPERLELGSVAMLGLVVDLLSLQEGKSPTLVLELGREVTNCYIVNAGGVDLARPIPHGVNSMIPVVQKELGLKDEEAAAKLLFSNTFDFTGMGSTLVKRLLKELQSSIGFYEVQTGQSIGRLLCTILPANHTWVANTLSESLGISPFKVEFDPWLQKQSIRITDAASWEKLGSSRFGLLSLMGRPQAAAKNHEGK